MKPRCYHGVNLVVFGRIWGCRHAASDIKCELSFCKCRHWWYWRLVWWQPKVALKLYECLHLHLLPYDVWATGSIWRTVAPLIARFMGPTWGPSGADRTQVGHILAPRTLLFMALSWISSNVFTRHTKFQNLNLSREWSCSWSSAESRCSNYIWVVNNFIAF